MRLSPPSTTSRSHAEASQLKRVVIVGGGFAGISAAKTLSKNPNLQITLIDKKNHHLFQPLLYQVALALLSPAEIAIPIRSILSSAKNIEVVMDEVKKISFSEKMVFTPENSYSYDYLLLACGATHSYFGHSDWEEFAPGLKNLNQATEIRKRVLLAFEKAEKETDPEIQKKFLTFVIVGGGPTGVELAGALAELAKITFQKDFKKIDLNQTRIILVEGADRILNAFDSSLSQTAEKGLKKLGVEVLTSSRVTQVNAEGVIVNQQKIPAHTVIWAAGVAPSPLNQTLDSQKDAQGRMIVSSDLSLPQHSRVFVVGDQSHFKDSSGSPLPGLAPVAIQQGIHAAKNILADLANQPRQPFQYFDKGMMAVIGRNRAVVQFRSLKIGGFFAWIMWLVIHIYYLIGFKNKVFVLLQWAWSYLTLKKGARLIIEKENF